MSNVNLATSTTTGTSQPVQERLAEIAAAVAAASSQIQATSGASQYRSLPPCPIDPAERAACDSCQ